MNASDVISCTLGKNEGTKRSVPMLPGEIAGAAVIHHTIPAGERMLFPADKGFVRILFLCDGEVGFSSRQNTVIYNEKAVFVENPQESVEVAANSAVSLLEIQWDLTEADWQEIGLSETIYPVTARYQDTIQYRDPFKSQKTISRAILPQRVLPRFAMGSVETYSDDLIGQHAHPLLDQFFFSFPENDMELLLDNIVYPMKGETLLHIPLGCNHGVQVGSNQCAHYIWIDFLIDERAAAYLDEVHQETGVKQEF